MNPEFSTWYAALSAKHGDRVEIVTRSHDYCGFACRVERIEGDTVHITIPFGSHDEHCTAKLSEVRFHSYAPRI